MFCFLGGRLLLQNKQQRDPTWSRPCEGHWTEQFFEWNEWTKWLPRWKTRCWLTSTRNFLCKRNVLATKNGEKWSSGQVLSTTFCEALMVRLIHFHSKKCFENAKNANLDLRFFLALPFPSFFSPPPIHISLHNVTPKPSSLPNKHPEMGSQSVNVHTAHWDGLKH